MHRDATVDLLRNMNNC